VDNVINVVKGWGGRPVIESGLIICWRHFPWPRGRGKTRCKRMIDGLFSNRGVTPIWTDEGWLVLEKGEDILQRQIYFNGRHYERAAVRFLKNEAGLQPGDMVFDVGGHVGYYTILMAKLIGPTGRLITFEPQQKLVEAQRKSLALNEIHWATVMNMAVSDRTGTLKLYQPEDTGRTGAATGHIQAKNVFSIKAVSLDEFAAAEMSKTPRLIKMDIEGGEWLALKGMRLLLSDSKPILLVEMHPQQIVALGGNQMDMIDTLSSHGYRVSCLHHKRGLEPLSNPLPGSPWHLVAKPVQIAN
jgi:FkbM family methyltransferase